MLKIIFNFEFKKIIREKGVYLIFFLFLPVIICFSIFHKIFSTNEIIQTSNVFVNFVFINFSVPWSLVLSLIISSDSYVKEKSIKIYDSILSTPVTIKSIVLAKSLVISIVSFIITMIGNFIILIGLNFFLYLQGNLIQIILPEKIALLIILLILPVILFSSTLILGFFSLTSKKQKILLLLISISIFGFFMIFTSQKELFQCTWELFYIMLSITISMFLISILLIRRLKKEDIILSV